MLRLRQGSVVFLNFVLIFISTSDCTKYGKLAADWATNIVKYTGKYVGKISNLNATEGLDLSDEDIAKLHIWPEGIIPYYIDDYSYDKVLRDRIRSFLAQTSGVTGLQFHELVGVPGPEGPDRWVMFINRQQALDCTDYPFDHFTNEGVQKVVLGYNCLGSGRQLPALLLSLVGVPPQHNAPNRDKSVTIVLENVMPGKKHLFDLFPEDTWPFKDMPYDFHSAGHYSQHEYTKNGFATIKPQEDFTDVELGERKLFSIGDILKIGMLYKHITMGSVKKAKASGCKKLFGPTHDIGKCESEEESAEKPTENILDTLISVNKSVENSKENVKSVEAPEIINLNAKSTEKSNEKYEGNTNSLEKFVEQSKEKIKSTENSEEKSKINVQSIENLDEKNEENSKFKENFDRKDEQYEKRKSKENVQSKEILIEKSKQKVQANKKSDEKSGEKIEITGKEEPFRYIYFGK